jgi:hypothetical protein
MDLTHSFGWLRQLLWVLIGPDSMKATVDDAARASRRHRPLGPEDTPAGIPPDVPVYNKRGFRQRPNLRLGKDGALSLTYLPREEFGVVVSFHEAKLADQGWSVTESYDDFAQAYRARRYDIRKDNRAGSIAVTETVSDLGPLEWRLVSVTMDLRTY